MTQTAGLWMLLALGVLALWTGLPIWALLLGVSGVFASLGLALGVFTAPVLSALPMRLVGLLEHDLLQAMPIYVLIGMLLQRTAIAEALFGTIAAVARPICRSTTGANALASLGVGALTAPMNGSVAASSALISRLSARRLQSAPAGLATALVSAAATVGVVVPPSLVLILLGDAMQRAHTEASQLPGYLQTGQRIVGTQDVLHAALPPALVLLLLWALIVWWMASRAPRDPAHEATSSAQIETRLRPSQTGLALAAVTGIGLVLAGVFTGRLLAVEGAAAAGCALAAGIAITRSLSWREWQAVLTETLALSGALFALLVGATTFSLVFRLFGTDALLSAWLMQEGLAPWSVAALALGLVLFCALVLDAFEMIFVIVPIVAPVLVLRLGDAQQAAVLLLLVLQLGFLLPPVGYAVLMVREYRRRDGAPQAPAAELLRALAPFLGAQLAVIALVLAAPRMVHWLDDPQGTSVSTDVPTTDDITRQMEDLAGQGEKESPAEEAETAVPAPK